MTSHYFDNPAYLDELTMSNDYVVELQCGLMDLKELFQKRSLMCYLGVTPFKYLLGLHLVDAT